MWAIEFRAPPGAPCDTVAVVAAVVAEKGEIGCSGHGLWLAFSLVNDDLLLSWVSLGVVELDER